MHTSIGAELARARERELLDRARNERFVRRSRRTSTRRSVTRFGAP